MKIFKYQIQQFAYQKGYKYKNKKIIVDGVVKISFSETNGLYKIEEVNDKEIAREFLFFMDF